MARKETKYHVGVGFTNRIYAGTLMPCGTVWRNKSDVTTEAVASVIQIGLAKQADGSELILTENGKPKYRVTIEEIVEVLRVEEKAE